MGSLSDQLLKSGLVNEKQAKKAKKQKHQKHKIQQKSKKIIVDEEQLALQKQQQAKIQRDKELNQQKNQQAEAKAIQAQIKQLIELNQQAMGDDEIAYNFSDGKLVKKINVSETIHQHISAGKLVIVKLANRYLLVPAIIAEKIKIRDESYIIVDNVNHQTTEIDDDYADYQIPDDLIW
ncbi:MAG: DUF2058 domain-containing protein [Methylococcales bacterium]|jgi:uncharacterized protein|nr:DUF2058 domain-containing protein [Methylococcales bacterium]